MTNKYRIVTDNYLGYEVQVKKWWFPFMWCQCDVVNTHATIECAERYIDREIHSGREVRPSRRVVKVIEENDVDTSYLDRIGANDE